ncbi:hypothetical protein BSF41_32650 [Flavobacterium sp. ACN2]|nr:hypothetical protein BSF41_32650 [Flavobacterium sp. ACN2]
MINLGLIINLYSRFLSCFVVFLFFYLVLKVNTSLMAYIFIIELS